ncbi:MAG: hypothetical protein HFH88_10570 [Lachnospiraceae bacterium]|nr:hypothetical protein [Lachnospiraceae bacterium]
MAQIWEELARGEAADLAIHGNQNLKQEGANSIYDFIRQYLDEGLAVKEFNMNCCHCWQKFDEDEKCYFSSCRD